ncbi:MAG: glutamine amidotransferase [Gammaproteobacteria bacterium]|nr:glutamine amidotransferase [Gammaproteobacteria bacterium]
MKQIALIKTGGTIEQIRQVHGDFEHWFANGMGVTDLLQVDVYKHQELPSAQSLAGVVITGSAAMVSEKEDWSERTARWLEKTVKKGTPVLGVCYGHQLLAHALGGRAGPNPAGRQIGTVTSKLLDSGRTDPLLEHLPSVFASQTSHSEVVLELPPGAERLATSPLDDNFAIRFAENAWGVQFHPEFSGVVMSEYIHYRSEAIREEGLNPEELLEKVTETAKANSVLGVFAELVNSKNKYR